jgi:hypothetical protein
MVREIKPIKIVCVEKIDRFGSDFVNSFGAVIPRVTSNAAFHNIFWSVTLDEARGVIYLKRYNNHFVARFDYANLR